MKIDRHIPRCFKRSVKRANDVKLSHWTRLLVVALITQASFCQFASAQQSALPTTRSDSIDTKTANTPITQSQAAAVNLIGQTIQRLAGGAAFNAKVRQRVWAAGREVVGVGTYEQAGGGTGRFNLHLTMHDGDGKHTLQQISDGRLTWTRTEIAESVSLKRVDVGRLDEWVRSSAHAGELPPRLIIGAWTEMLDTIKRDYVLTIGRSQLNGQRMLVVSGTLREESRQQLMQATKSDKFPALYPSHVVIAIATQNDPETGFGKGLPVRLEFWTDPDGADNVAAAAGKQAGRLVTLIELYSMHAIRPPPAKRFLMDSHDTVNIVNETDRYLRQYGIHLTESQRRQLLR